MKNKPRIYYLQWDEALYLSHTICLSDMEDLVYRRLIGQYFLQKSLPSDLKQLCKFARIRHDQFIHYWGNIQKLTHTFIVDGDRLRHPYIDGQIENIQHKSEVMSEVSRKRWGKSSEQNMPECKSNAKAMRAKAMQKQSYTDTDTDIKEKVEKESYPQGDKKPKPSAVRASPRTPSVPDLLKFEEIEGLNLDAWTEWQAYRSRMKFKKYKTTAKAKQLAILPSDKQLECIEHSISNQYQGLFPEKFKQPKPKSNGNGSWQDQPPPRAQPPEASQLSNDHNRPLTEEQKKQFRENVRKAKMKIKGNGNEKQPEPKQDTQTDQQPTMAQLLLAAKSCHAAWESQGDCGSQWNEHKEIKCHWCAKFETQRNTIPKKNETKQIGDLL